VSRVASPDAGSLFHLERRRGSALGFGLDDQAVDAVRRWVFSPATKNGEPVDVRINVEVNFKLY